MMNLCCIYCTAFIHIQEVFVVGAGFAAVGTNTFNKPRCKKNKKPMLLS